LDIVVSRHATDLFDLNLEFAAHEIDNARLRLEDREIHFVGSGIIDFTDNSSGLSDLLVFHGNFEHLGVVIDLGSAVALPPSTFQLSQFLEPPPLFGSTAETSGGVCCGGVYAAVVAEGTQLVVIPEPTSSNLLSAVAIAGFACYSLRYLRQSRRCFHE
jgi:hypothetical protein